MDGKVESSAEADLSGASEDATLAPSSSPGPTRTVQSEAPSNGTVPRSAEPANGDPEAQAALSGTPTVRFKRQDSGSRGEYKVPGFFPPSLSVL